MGPEPGVVLGRTHFPRAKRAAFAIVDVVSRKWIATVVTAEESSTQVQLLFADALDAEGLVAGPAPVRDHPLLLAMSDNGGPMISHATREFFAASPNGWAGLAPPPTRRGSSRCAGTSRPTGPTSSSSPTRPCAFEPDLWPSAHAPWWPGTVLRRPGGGGP